MMNVRGTRRQAGSRRIRWVVATVALLGGVLSMAAVVVTPPAPASAFGDSTGSTISTGAAHSCGVTTAGAATCWGSNSVGQLGNNSTTSSTTPVPVSGLSSGVTAISAGNTTTTCAVASGAASCWGGNSNGVFGNNSTTGSLVPTPVSGLTSGVTSISVGSTHACAVVSGGAFCWGSNTNGQLGNNSTTQSLVPVPVQGLGSGVTAISAGESVSCAIASGAAWCWGAAGKLGNSASTQSLVPVQPTGLTSGVTAISVGSTETCAVVSGAAKCWGGNQDGGIGDGTATARTAPTQVSGMTSGVTSISVGRWFACGVVSGAARCWGNNEYGQLGNSTINDGLLGTGFGSRVPVPVTGLGSGVTTIAAGYRSTCAVGSGGVASCWGTFAGGVTGNDHATTTPTPQQVLGLTSGASAPAGTNSSTCAVLSGAAKCWGHNLYRQTADTTNHYVYQPNTPVTLGSDVTAAASGGVVACAVVSGAAKCWGQSTAQIGANLGEFSTGESGVPNQVIGLTSGVTAIAAGTSHNCAVASGGAKCWGAGGSGRLGDGQSGARWSPTQVTGLTSGVTAIAAGDAHTCAVVSGAARCWGANASGQLGNGSTTLSNVPVAVSGLTSGVTSIATGTSHTCAVVSGAAWCWGLNSNGQLGNNSTTASLVPVQVQGLTSGVTAIAAGASHSCAVVSGAVQCWGSNASYKAGGSVSGTNLLTPSQVTGLTSGAGSVSASGNHSCAEVSGALTCWGATTLGQIGAMDPSTPSVVKGGLTFAAGVLPAAPTISGSRSPAANANGWNNEPVVVSFTCTSTALASCTSPVAVSTDGADQSVTGTVTDTAAQTASTTVSGISIDRVGPTLAGITVTAPNDAGWYRAPVTMDWTCDDARSGVAPDACPAASTTTGEGTSVSVSASVTDRAGNQTTASSESVQIDLTKPSTGVSSPPTWSTSNVTLELSPTDALSGVASTFYKVDGDTTQGGTAPVISGQGVHTVEFWSVDVAGNEENHQSVQVRIDVQAPSITAARSVEPNAAGWNNWPVTVSFDCGDEDGGSGVASCSAPQSFPTQVDTTATGTVSDGAGNTASVQVPVRIDTTDPTVTADVPTANANGWFNAPVQVPFTCADTGGSGIATCPAPVVFGGDGADQPVTGEAVDAAGNTGTASGATVSLDQVAPTISGASVEPANPGGGYYGNVTVRWTCADALSGVVTCPADVPVSGEGVHVVSRSVTDRAGNTSTAEVTIQINHDPSTDPGTVQGVISDSTDANPVVGAVVTLRTTSNAIVATTTTGTGGTYTFPAVADGTYKLFAAQPGAYLGAYRAGTFTVAHGTSTAADLALAPMLVLSGTVRTAGGAPIAGATVRVAPASAVAVTDATGAYRVTGLNPGAVTVKVLATGYVSPADAAFTLTSSRIHDVNLAAAPAGGGVKGTIAAQANGAPLAGATVRIWLKGATTYSQTVSTGSDGRFSVPSLAVGTYEIDAVAMDHQVRWFGDSLSRSGAAPVAITTGCTANPNPAWGDPCAFPVTIALRR